MCAGVFVCVYDGGVVFRNQIKSKLQKLCVDKIALYEESHCELKDFESHFIVIVLNIHAIRFANIYLQAPTTEFINAWLW